VIDADSIEALAIARWGEPNRRMSTRSELRFGKRGSVSVALRGDKKGCWYDHEAGEGGWLGNPADAHERPSGGRERPRFSRSLSHCDDLAAMLAVSGPLTDDCPVARYLRSRAITRWPSHNIRWRQRGGNALMALVQTESGEILAGHVIYVDRDGRGVECFGARKRTYAGREGWNAVSAVRLPGSGTPILCEGVETGLSIWQSLARNPVFCCLGSGNIGAFRVPNKRVIIAADGDAPDSQAWRTIDRAAASLKLRGANKVTIIRPPTGKDFNDILQSSGEHAVRDYFYAERQGK
jgi:phage/plasmid primase-like uncharacterized protein